MARINIEDSIFRDDRFHELIVKTGNRHTAKGMVIELWTIAQEYWVPNKQCIPHDRIKKAGLELTIQVGLAEVSDAGVFAVGSEKAFSWLFAKQAGSKNGGKSRAASAKRDKNGQFNKKIPSVKPAFDQADPGSSSALTLSPTLSLPPTPTQTPAPTQKERMRNEENLASPAPADAVPTPNLLIAFYCEEYKSKYKFNPPIDGKSAGLAKTLLKDFGLEKAKKLIAAYLKMNDKRFIDKRHDFATMKLHLNSVAHFEQLGVSVTQTQLNQIDQRMARDDAFDSAIQKIKQGEPA